MKLIIGFCLGIACIIAFPDTITYVSDTFVESGVRDFLVSTLQNIGDNDVTK